MREILHLPISFHLHIYDTDQIFMHLSIPPDIHPIYLIFILNKAICERG